VFLVQCSRSTSYITQRCNACNWLKCAASTGVGITGVGIAGVGIAVCSRLSWPQHAGVLDQLRMERDDNETERTSDVTLTTSSYAIAERPRDALS